VILVVDDDKDLREALAVTLRDVGYEVHTACDGKDALDFVRAGARPCLVLLDLAMPEMDGEEFIARLAGGADELASIPVFVITAYPEIKSFGLPSEIGLLRKPFDLDVILQIVEKYC
jgi:CheY-like chemotaxis protein